VSGNINPLNAKLNPICHFLALLGAHPILHVSRIRVKEEIVLGYVTLPSYVTTRKKESALNLYYQRTFTFSRITLISVQNDLRLSVRTVLARLKREICYLSENFIIFS